MSSVNRQNRLIVAEDWTKIYQTFTNADFKSYDFDNLRRTMISYLRENYPEDFNDYIESSEYLALIDMIAFLGQNLAFRFDLNARDNFLELASRRESILRLARLISYNPNRNQCANGLLKFNSISTTESVIDSNGRNVANQVILWNDTTNTNWYDQFIKILNAALPLNSQFGNPQDSAEIFGLPTEQYRFNANNTDVPMYSFMSNINGYNMNFEITSASFKNASSIYEEAPLPGNHMAFLYRNDGSGPGSSNTGFFAYFKQGTLEEATFSITNPSTNEAVDINQSNVNNSDIWLYLMDTSGKESTLWTKVDSTVGNNVIYNSINKNIRSIYSVITKTFDQIRLVFSDGVFGDLPQGNFKTYFRVSNGLEYSINPTDINNVVINVPYISKTNVQETLTITLALKYTVNNATTSETSANIKANAPSTYYTQGRMITGEDYNILPLSSNQQIIKAKAINRVSSGISRYFDLKDTTGKYSSTNLFGSDGILYKEPIDNLLSFSFVTQTDVENAVINKIIPIMKRSEVLNFYLDNYSSIDLLNTDTTFVQVTSSTNISTGYIIDTTEVKKIGSYTLSNLQYIIPGAMIKFVPPSGHVFNAAGQIVVSAKNARTYIWVKVVNVIGDGTGNGSGMLDTGYGAITFNDVIPTGAILSKVIPKFTTALLPDIQSQVVDLIFLYKKFGLRYDINTASWKIITDSNLDTRNNFSLKYSGDISNQQLDASWIILAETDGQKYTITNRETRYVFESEHEIRFFFDSSEKVYDTATSSIIRDRVTVLGINSQPDATSSFEHDFNWEIVGSYNSDDGYVDTTKISLSFFDSNDDDIVDDPELFDSIVSPSTNPTQKYIFRQLSVGLDGTMNYFYIPNDNDLIIVKNSLDDINTTAISNGQLVYSIADNLVYTFDQNTTTFKLNANYRGYCGRDNLKFQYVHAASSTVRIDPSATNIIDLYLLVKSYDQEFKSWLNGIIKDKPLPPSSDELEVNFGSNLNKIKSISDSIIYHPVNYKLLFGTLADKSLQAIFKVVVSPGIVISDNDVKTGVMEAINQFFSIENWDFGDTFYFSELATYVMNEMAPDIANIVIVPVDPSISFGGLFQIMSNSDEIFANCATVDNIEIISDITTTKIQAVGQVNSTIITSTNQITSR